VAAGAAVLILALTRGPSEKEVAKNGEQDKSQKDSSKDKPNPEDENRELTPKQIMAKVAKSIALIETPGGGGGSGFVVLPGIIATNAHVVDGVPVSSIKIRFPSGDETTKKLVTADHVIAYDRKRDLSFVVLATAAPPLKIADHFQFEPGEKIVAIGSPGALGTRMENAITSGVLSSKTTFNGEEYYQVSVAINPGNSGGPIFNSRGQVIGVATLKARDKEQLNFCIPVEDLQKHIERVAKISKDKYDLLTSEYNACTVFRRIAKADKVFIDGTKTMVIVWHDAIKSGKMFGQAEADVVRKNIIVDWNRKGWIPFAKVDKEMSSAVAKVGSDRAIPESARSKFPDLWTNFEGLRDRFFFAGVGTWDNYRAAFIKGWEKHDELVGSLRVALGIEEWELELNE
jgi:S1-C subfamily serine protease